MNRNNKIVSESEQCQGGGWRSLVTTFKFVIVIIAVLILVRWFTTQYDIYDTTVKDKVIDSEDNKNAASAGKFIFVPESPDTIVNGETFGEDDSTCKPRSNIVFIKTAKTGGSTMSDVIYRYGLKNGLVAAVDPGRHYLIKEDGTGNHYIIQTYNCSDFPGYNIMASHIYYNRPAMEEIVKDAKYVTLLRSPHSHLKSFFYFSGRDQRYPNAIDPLEEFVTERYEKFIDNDRLVDSGFNEYFPRFRLPLTSDKDEILFGIQQLDREIDLVMLTEYYDESLVLLKKLMCWDFEDILYRRMKVHHDYQPAITKKSMRMISELSEIDIQMYQHFNTTFWEKVKNYNGDFQADLKKFRSLLDDVSKTCQDGSESPYCELMHADANKLSIRSLKMNEKWIC